MSTHYDNYILCFDTTLLMRIKFFLFGKKTVEYAGMFVRAEWVEYNGKLYLVKYGRF